jgi:hypothetical protein
MIKAKKYAVYYRDIPAVLQALIAKDGQMSLCKDGVYVIDGHSCPRLTITVEPVPGRDNERLRNLEQLLDELDTNNQIAGWA